MKKIAIFFFTIIIIVVWISYAYLNYKASYNNAKKGNMPLCLLSFPFLSFIKKAAGLSPFT